MLKEIKRNLRERCGLTMIAGSLALAVGTAFDYSNFLSELDRQRTSLYPEISDACTTSYTQTGGSCWIEVVRGNRMVRTPEALEKVEEYKRFKAKLTQDLNGSDRFLRFYISLGLFPILMGLGIGMTARGEDSSEKNG